MQAEGRGGAGVEVKLVDTTFRDGSQSLWASGMRTGMIEAVAEPVGRAGFAVVEVPFNGIYIKKFVRDLKEDPWDLARMLVAKMPDAVKACMAGGNLTPLGAPSPKSVVKLFFERVAAIGVLNRAQMFANTYGQLENEFPWTVPMFRELGLQVVIGLSYTISPRHTDEYYAGKMRELLRFKPDAIFLEDQCGILTMDRARTLIPALLENSGGVSVELHAHCTTGLMDQIYLEAVKLGVRTLHTALPPLASGTSQPSVFNVARNLRLMGYTTTVDEELLRPAAERLTAIAREEGLPIGAPLELDCAQYIHQMPGGVISNLKHQLAQVRLQDRLDEVLEETVRIRKELGYPIMVTPHSQFVATQAAINVATSERWKVVLDELILFAKGVYGEDSGYTWMDPNLKDRFLSSPRARELGGPQGTPETPLREIREKFGGPGVSDEELLLRYIMKGAQEIQAMRAAGPPKRYSGATAPLLSLLQELSRTKRVSSIRVRSGEATLVLGKSARPDPAARAATPG